MEDELLLLLCGIITVELSNGNVIMKCYISFHCTAKLIKILFATISAHAHGLCIASSICHEIHVPFALLAGCL